MRPSPRFSAKPDARPGIAGGASLLDHGAYQAAFGGKRNDSRRIAHPPFTGYLEPSDAIWFVPFDSASIAAALRQCLRREVAERLRARGPAVAAGFPWSDVARRHLPVYRRLREPAHA